MFMSPNASGLYGQLWFLGVDHQYCQSDLWLCFPHRGNISPKDLREATVKSNLRFIKTNMMITALILGVSPSSRVW